LTTAATTAAVFPGQGSQTVGMLADIAPAHPQVGDTFAEAASVLGIDLWTLSQSGPAEALADTRVTQPLMFTADIALWRSLRSAGMPMPGAVAGHSLGEFAALVACGALDFAAGLALVKRRAELMATAVPDGEGGMAAVIGADDETVIAVCKEISAARTDGHTVEAVNFNAPGQVALSGHLDAVEAACELARERGARRAMLLPVSVPNHSSLMRDAGAELEAAIDAAQWQEPQCSIVQNAQASAPASLEALVTSLKSHVFSPVRWTASIEALRDSHGVTRLVECGPGKVLTGLSRRIDKQLPCLPTDTAEGLDAALEVLSTQQTAGSEA
jgi:[acyl-carrier-protein] S-malonyltransferase